MRGALLPTTVAPMIFLLGTTGQFGRLADLSGFPTTSYLAWILPLSCLQGAGFAGGAAGANLARDIEQGWFDRLLTSPAPRPLLLAGPVLAAMTRAAVPTTVILLDRARARQRAQRRHRSGCSRCTSPPSGSA